MSVPGKLREANEGLTHDAEGFIYQIQTEI